MTPRTILWISVDKDKLLIVTQCFWVTSDVYHLASYHAFTRYGFNIPYLSSVSNDTPYFWCMVGFWFSWFLIKEIHHGCIFPVQGVILALRVHGPSGPSSCYGPLTWWGLKRGSGETSSPLALPAVAWRVFLGFGCIVSSHASPCLFKDGCHEVWLYILFLAISAFMGDIWRVFFHKPSTLYSLYDSVH